MIGERAEPAVTHRDHQRELTVVFVDMVGSTGIAERLDPEVLRDVVLGYHEICEQAIRRYDGFVARRVGDGVLACFGHPHAHEDDPRRAVMAGLSITEAMAPLSRRLDLSDDLAVRVRVAVHTGPVVLTHIGDTLELVGSTVNEAARLEAEARPGEVVVSDTTERLISSDFECEARGEADLKGVTRAIPIHVVRRPTDAADLPAAVTAMVGRAAERTRLLDLWAATRDDGDGVAPVVLMAAPGIGKTRLAQHLCDVAIRDEARPLVARSRPFDTDVPFHLLASMLHRSMAIDDSRPEPEQVAALRSGLEADGADPDALAPHLGQVLDLDPQLLGVDAAMDTNQVRARIIEAFVSWWRARAAHHPFVLLLEDLQWADPSTLEVVDALVRASPIPGLMILMTARPELAAGWLDAVEVIRLERLGPDDTAQLCRILADTQALSDEEIDTLIRRSDGVPLFVEGLVSSVRQGNGSGEKVPGDVRSLLDSMIHAPGVDPQFVSLLATVGQEIQVDLVAEIVGSDVDTVRRRCETLRSHSVLDRVPDVTPETFTFHHALIRTEAYEQQLASDRRAAHALVADAIVAGSSIRRLDPATTARHLDLGGRPREAVELYLTAVTNDQAKGAHTESRRLIERVLELLTHLPASPERDRLELQAQLRLALSLTSTEGYGSSRAMRTLERARGLARTIGDVRRQVEVLGDIFSYYSVRGERLASIDVIEEMSSLITDGGPDIEVDVLMFDGLLQFTLGRFGRSRHCYSTAIDRLVERGIEQGGELDRIALPSDGLASGCAMMVPLAILVDDDEGARSWIERGLARSTSLGAGKGAFSEGFVRSWITFEHIISGEFVEAIAEADVMIGRAERAGLPMWVGLGTAARTIAAGHHDPQPAHDALLGAIIDAMAAMGVAAMAPYFLTHHGLIRAHLGEPADGIARLTEAIEIGDRHGEVHYHAETLRHRGLLRLADAANDDPAPGLADLTAATQLACEQEAPLYAARAFCDLVDAGGTPSAGLLAALDGCLGQLHPNSSRAEVARAVALLRAHAGAR